MKNAVIDDLRTQIDECKTLGELKEHGFVNFLQKNILRIKNRESAGLLRTHYSIRMAELEIEKVDGSEECDG